MMKAIKGQSKKNYNIAAENDVVNIELYGNIVSDRPKDYDTGNPSDMSYIVQSEFVKALDDAGTPKTMNIRISSFGGEVVAALVIYNRLRDLAAKGTQINCIVDGAAMSAGTLILCAADKVSATESSIIMIHKSLAFYFGWYNADMLRKEATENDAYDKTICAAYKRKTGKKEDELYAMMSEERFMTGKEAVELGFVDELLEEDDTPEIAASEDKKALYVGGKRVALFGAKCPENIPTVALQPVLNITDSTGAFANSNTINDKGGNTMDGSEITATLENTENKATIAVNPNSATLEARSDEEIIARAVAEERERIRKIDEIAPQFDAKTVRNAKYDKPCSAEEMAYRAAVESAKLGKNFLRDVAEDNRTSEVQKVTQASAPDEIKAGTVDEANMTEEQKMEEARSVYRQAMGGDKK